MVIVTHNMQQASRVSDYTAFLYLGELVEYQETEKLFMNPASRSRPKTTSPAGSDKTHRFLLNWLS